MNLSQESFDTLVKRNSELEAQLVTKEAFSEVKWLNDSQSISQVGSWSWDIKNDKLFWSDMMFDLLGLDVNEKPPSYELALHHVHDDDKAAYEICLGKAMAEKSDYYFENRITRKDKTSIEVISRGVCICNDEGELTGMSGTVQDITLLKQTLNTNAQLEVFAHVLAHDFKTPLRTIISFVSLIRKKGIINMSEEGEQYFSFIESGALHLSSLIDDILEYSKLSSPDLYLVKVPTAELVKTILFDLNITLVEKQGKVTVGWLPEFINVDRIKIRQVIQNLISNAIKYVPADTKPEIEIYAEQVAGKVSIYVKDNGIGIAKSNHKKIFEPYLRIDNDKNFWGTGIGLSICKKIVKFHKGEIGCFSNEDKGTCFYFSIPLE